MAFFGSLLALVKGDNSQFKKTMADTRQEITKTQGGYRGFLKDLKKDFGKGSLLGQSLKLAAGGGAIAGLSAAAKELEEFTGKINELKNSKLGGAELTDQLLKAVPIYGNIYKAALNVREAITGEAAAQAKMNALMEQQIKFSKQVFDNLVKLQEQEKQAKGDNADIRKDSARKRALAALTDEHDKKILQIGFDEEDARDKINKGVEDAKKAAEDAARQVDQVLNRKHSKSEADQALQLLKSANTVRERMEKDAQETISQIERDAEQERYQEQEAQRQDQIQKDLDAAKKAAEDEAQQRKELLQKMDEQQRDEIARLKDERKDLLNSVQDEAYRGAQSQSRRGATFALYEPKSASKLEKLGDDQLKQLQSIDKRLEELTGKPVKEDGGDLVINIG